MWVIRVDNKVWNGETYRFQKETFAHTTEFGDPPKVFKWKKVAESSAKKLEQKLSNFEKCTVEPLSMYEW